MKINQIFENSKPTFVDYLSYKNIQNTDEYFSHKYLEDIYNFDNIIKASETINDAIKNKYKFYLLLDEDCDGLFSTCIQYMFLKKCDENIDVKVIFHNKNRKAHGLNDDEVLYILKNEDKNDNKVLWVADASSNDSKEFEELKNYNYINICTDHHEKTNENDYAIIVNNQYSEGIKNKSLSGAGVTFKLCQAIDKINNTHYTRDLICYVHLSNISDSCSFVNSEQNTFRYWGLKLMHENIIPFIKKFNYNNGLENMDFSFGIISKFNSVIRVGSLEDKKTLFYSLSTGRNIEDAIDICDKCKKQQDKEVEELMNNNIFMIYDSNIMIFKVDKKTPLTGLIANKLMSKYNKPIFLLYENDTEVSGSCRSTVDIRYICEQSNLFNYASGHERSFGVSYEKENEQEILNWINKLDISEPQIEVLKKYDAKHIQDDIFDDFVRKGIYGQGIQEPVLYITNIKVSPKNIKVLGKNKRTLKITYNNIDYMIFNATNEDKEKLTNHNITIEVFGTMDINIWNNRKTNQIKIKNFTIKKKALEDFI